MGIGPYGVGGRLVVRRRADVGIGPYGIGGRLGFGRRADVGIGPYGGTGDPSPAGGRADVGIGPYGGALLTALGLAFGVCVLFFGALFLRARSVSLTAVVDRFFPDRPAKLLGCGLLFGLCCLLGLLLGVFRAGGLRAWFRRVAGSRLHRAAALAALTGVLLLLLGSAWLGRDRSPTPIRLNEVCCANWSLRPDPDNGEYADYLELINTGDEAVDLGGYFISDSAKKRGRFRLPSLTLEPGACLLLWADGAGTSGQQGGKNLHLNFSLEPGETVWLSSPRGVLLDYVTVPDWYQNISLSRKEATLEEHPEIAEQIAAEKAEKERIYQERKAARENAAQNAAERKPRPWRPRS